MQTAWRLLPLLLVGVLAFGVAGLPAAGIGRGDAAAPADRRHRRRVQGRSVARRCCPRRTTRSAAWPGRFNAMTNYLREARAEEAQANTARLAMETRLRHSEKLATMGQMAAEIAHEVGTPLNVIGGRARSLARRSQDPAEVQKNARHHRRAGRAHHQDHPPGAGLLAQEPAHPEPGGRPPGGGRGAGVHRRDAASGSGSRPRCVAPERPAQHPGRSRARSSRCA